MFESLVARSFLAPTHSASIRREESALILLNLAVLAGIAVVHVLFGPLLGTPSHVFYLLLLGFFAVSTGQSAGELADRNEAVSAVLERHEQLAETTRIVFAVLTVIFATIVLAPMALRRVPGRATSTILALVFLLFYGAGGLLLVNTAHNGGRLVHELGVRAMVAQSGAHPIATTAPPEAEEKD